MSNSKTNSPAVNVSSYHATHILVLTITCVFGAISGLAMFYDIWIHGSFSDERFRLPFAIGVSIAGFLLAIMPAAFAKAHGEAITGASAQSSILMVVLLIMVADGAFQWHAVNIIFDILGAKPLSWWQMTLVIGAIQIALFASRGALAASTAEQKELVASQQERIAAIEARERAEKNALRREKYAEKKASGKVVPIR